jgi:hypothetical protein
MTNIDSDTSLRQLAVLVSQALQRAGIVATLSGGGAVSVYSENEYESRGLDFITVERTRAIADAISPLGFRHVAGARQFEHPGTEYYVEFPPGPLAFGDTVVPDTDAATLQTEFGPVRIVTPTQSVMDRLAAYVHWNDNPSLDQAIMVARRQAVDWPALYEWARREGVGPEVVDKVRSRSGAD